MFAWGNGTAHNLEGRATILFPQKLKGPRSPFLGYLSHCVGRSRTGVDELEAAPAQATEDQG